jgi:hypothetical protein
MQESVIEKNRVLNVNDDWITIMYPPGGSDRQGLTFFQRMKRLHDSLQNSPDTNHIALQIANAYMDCL